REARIERKLRVPRNAGSERPRRFPPRRAALAGPSARCHRAEPCCCWPQPDGRGAPESGRSSSRRTSGQTGDRAGGLDLELKLVQELSHLSTEGKDQRFPAN